MGEFLHWCLLVGAGVAILFVLILVCSSLDADEDFETRDSPYE